MKLSKLKNGSGFIIPTIRKRGYLIANNVGSSLVALEESDGTRKRTTISLGTNVKKSNKAKKFFESLGYGEKQLKKGNTNENDSLN